MIIWGWKTYPVVLAVLMLPCGQCGNHAEQQVYRITTKFTLFWIPLFPIAARYLMTCAACAQDTKIPKEHAMRLAEGGAQPGAAQQPMGPPQGTGPQPTPGYGPPSGPQPAMAPMGPPATPPPGYGPPQGPPPGYGPPQGRPPGPPPGYGPPQGMPPGPPPGYGPPQGMPPRPPGPPPGYPPQPGRW